MKIDRTEVIKHLDEKDRKHLDICFWEYCDRCDRIDVKIEKVREKLKRKRSK